MEMMKCPKCGIMNSVNQQSCCACQALLHTNDNVPESDRSGRVGLSITDQQYTDFLNAKTISDRVSATRDWRREFELSTGNFALIASGLGSLARLIFVSTWASTTTWSGTRLMGKPDASDLNDFQIVLVFISAILLLVGGLAGLYTCAFVEENKSRNRGLIAMVAAIIALSLIFAGFI